MFLQSNSFMGMFHKGANYEKFCFCFDRDLPSKNSITFCFSVNDYNSIAISKGQILKHYQEWSPSFRIEFDIMVSSVLKEIWTNVFHFTIGGNNHHYGDRIPAFWIKSNKKFCIFSAVNNDKDHRQDFDFDMNQEYHIVIRQFYKQCGKYVYQIEIDGQIKHSVDNNNAKVFENVKLYASDPWYTPFTSNYGLLKNLKVEQGRSQITQIFNEQGCLEEL